MFGIKAEIWWTIKTVLGRVILAVLLLALIVICSPQYPSTPKAKPVVPPCDCGQICNEHFHCGLESCPHGK